MIQFYNLLTPIRGSEIHARIAAGTLHPKTAKQDLAERLVSRFHSETASKNAREEFDKVFSSRQNPTDMPEISMPAGEHLLTKVITAAALAESGGAARRLVEQGAVTWDGRVYADPKTTVQVGDMPVILRVGKTRFVRIRGSKNQN
jgi:tyrosyl-tRNA synthetase